MKVIESIWAKIQLAITVLGGALGYFLGGLDGLLIALIVFVVLVLFHSCLGGFAEDPVRTGSAADVIAQALKQQLNLSNALSP